MVIGTGKINLLNTLIERSSEATLNGRNRPTLALQLISSQGFFSLPRGYLKIPQQTFSILVQPFVAYGY